MKFKFDNKAQHFSTLDYQAEPVGCCLIEFWRYSIALFWDGTTYVRRFGKDSIRVNVYPHPGSGFADSTYGAGTIFFGNP